MWQLGELVVTLLHFVYRHETRELSAVVSIGCLYTAAVSVGCLNSLDCPPPSRSAVCRGVTHMRSSHQSNFYLYGDHKTAVYKDPVSAAVAVDLFNIVYLRAADIDTLNFSIAGYRKSDKVFEFLDTAIAAAPRFHKPSFATRDELAGWLKSVDTPTLGSAPSDIVDAVSVPEILQKSAKKPCRHSSRRSGS